MSIPNKVKDKLIKEMVSNWGSIAKKISKDGAGRRLFPSRTPKIDERQPLRVDQWSEFTDKPGAFTINVQKNNAGPVSHEKVATVIVDTNKSMKKEELKKALAEALDKASQGRRG